MLDRVLLTKSYGSVLVDADLPCLVIKWHGFVSSDEFIFLLRFGMVYLETHPRPRRPWGWIADVQHLTVVPPAGKAWLTTEFNKRAMAAGLREIGMVLARQDALDGQNAQLNAHQVAPSGNGEPLLPFYFFDSLEAAKAGLRPLLAAR